MINTEHRVMGELIFLHGDAEAEAAGAKLRTDGFDFKICDDVDECSDDTRFVMVWRDYDTAEEPDRLLRKFAAEVDTIVGGVDGGVDAIIGIINAVKYVGFVKPNHVPAVFSDYGEPFGDLIHHQEEK
jgi:hypothetical protein